MEINNNHKIVWVEIKYKTEISDNSNDLIDKDHCRSEDLYDNESDCDNSHMENIEIYRHEKQTSRKDVREMIPAIEFDSKELNEKYSGKGYILCYGKTIDLLLKESEYSQYQLYEIEGIHVNSPSLAPFWDIENQKAINKELNIENLKRRKLLPKSGYKVNIEKKVTLDLTTKKLGEFNNQINYCAKVRKLSRKGGK